MGVIRPLQTASVTDTVTKIDGPKRRRKDSDIRLAAGDHEGAYPFGLEDGIKATIEPGRIRPLVELARRRHQCGEVRDKSTISGARCSPVIVQPFI